MRSSAHVWGNAREDEDGIAPRSWGGGVEDHGDFDRAFLRANVRQRDDAMMRIADIAPPSSLLLIMDRSVGQLPESMAGRLVAFTPTCVAIGTLSSDDGSTRVTLSDGGGPPAHGALVFDGVLETPGLTLAVCSVLDEVVLALAAATVRTRVRIWANHESEPSEIDISATAELV